MNMRLLLRRLIKSFGSIFYETVMYDGIITTITNVTWKIYEIGIHTYTNYN